MLQIYLKPCCSSKVFSRDICRHAFKSLHIGNIEEKQEKSEKALTFVLQSLNLLSL